MLDSATRFFIAVPMKKIDSVSVAEALMGQFCIFGNPRVIHMDHGSNLSSELMRQLYHLYGIHVRQSSVFHPMGNSVIERNHATMKSILKKLIVEQRKQWHRCISPLLNSGTGTYHHCCLLCVAHQTHQGIHHLS